ncbi:Nif3-like dinuclear metal center hexameric protein [Helicobacter bizzozeronii]|uniref:Nif3-like dinuclear metal center hexameric protein n=1 Tax=Helicobacter bizzozeronii TaxID=56877 RepID=UPI000CEDD920|nr:Nif3-like dinuclear metal center hexameric protein [Helicobacter bizzozeronii]
MQIEEIYAFLDQLSPFTLQESWDHSGLNLGSLGSEFERVAISLEATLELAQEVKPKTLILTHHPLFFKPLKNFDPTLYPCNIAQILIQKSCSLIALHTNFDQTHLNAHFASLLGFEGLQAHGFALQGKLESTPLEDLAQQVQERLNLPYVRFVRGASHIEHIAIICGSGGFYLDTLTNPPPNFCLITGDLKHHESMAALSRRVSLIEVEHYESEKAFVPLLHDLLQPYILQTQLKHVKLFDCKSPFTLKVR